MLTHIIGLDLGQLSDPTAVAIVERRQLPKSDAHAYACRHLQRWPLGTPYPAIVGDVLELLARPQLAGPLLVIDQTGVGRAVVDLFRWRSPCPMKPVTITSGATVTRLDSGEAHVPKKDLVATLQTLLGYRRLQVAATLPEAGVLVKELQNFRVKVTAAANETFGCFVAGTTVETSLGPVAIERVRPGCRVLTRNGYRRVLWAGPTKRVRELAVLPLGGGRTLAGTSDHLVWTNGRGWIPLASVVPHDELIVSCRESHPTQRLFASTGRSTGSVLATNISRVAGAGRRLISTGTFGLFTTGRSRRVTSSTTVTATRATTALTTSSAWAGLSTAGFTSRGGPGSALSAGWSLAAKTVAATAVPAGALREASSPPPAIAAGAARSTDPSAPTPCSVPPFAGRRTATLAGARHAAAPDAAGRSWPSTGYRNTAPVAAPPVIVRLSGSLPVYDLTVEGEHEFFANGVLVHNSWREGQHDDLVLALALACWVGEHGHAGEWGPAPESARSEMSRAPEGVFAEGESPW
jgi:hypothetical protein